MSFYLLTVCNAVCSPDVGISIPVQNMVENSLEKNGPKILLPQILDAMTALQNAAQKTTGTTDSATPSSGSTHADSAPVECAPGKSSGAALDLPLPIIIPGFKAGGGSDSGVKSGNKKESMVEQLSVKAKPKPKASSDSAKEVKGVVKMASQKGNSVKVVGSKLKEKDDKSSVDADEKEEGTEVHQIEDGSSKEKGRGTGASGKVKKTPKEEKMPGQRDKESDKQPETKVCAKEKESAPTDADQKEEVRTEASGKKEKEVKEKPKPELKSEAAPEQMTEQEQVEKESNEEEVEENKGSVPASGGSGGNVGRKLRKQPVSKRRSARLASLNEGSSDEQGKNSNEKAKSSDNKTEADLNREDPGKSMVSEAGKKRATAAAKPKSSATASSRASGGRKRLRVLESSSDEDTVKQMSSGDEEKGYESETEQQQEEEEEAVEEQVRGRRRKRKRVRARKSLGPTDDAQQSQRSSQSSKGLAGHKRSLGVGKEDQGVRRSSSPASKRVKTRPGGKQLQEERKPSPAKQKSPSPVVTRYTPTLSITQLYHTVNLFIVWQVQPSSETQPSLQLTQERQHQQLVQRGQ